MPRITLSTARPDVVLREFGLVDARALFALIETSRKHLSQRDDNTAHKYKTLAEVRKSIATPVNPTRRRFGIWMSGVLVGTINLTPDEDGACEVGYWIGAAFINRGLATLATKAIAAYALSLGAPKVYGVVHPENIASQKVLLRAGFVRTLRMKKYVRYERVP